MSDETIGWIILGVLVLIVIAGTYLGLRLSERWIKQAEKEEGKEI